MPGLFRDLRRVWLLSLASAALVAALVLVSWWFFRGTPRENHTHWDAVARGRVYLQRGRPDLALQAVSMARDEAPGAGEAMTIAGMALVRLGEYRAARQALERALQLEPNQFQAAVSLAELNFGLGNGNRGIELLETAARLRPGEFRIWQVMGKVLHDLGDFPKAIESYQKALKLKPDDRDTLVALIGTLIYKGVSDQAEPYIAQARQKYPDDPAVLAYAARRALDTDQIDEAMSLAEQALQHDPNNVQALLTRAQGCIVRSRWQDALPAAERAVAARPNDISALQLLLTIESRLGLTQRAAATQVRRQRAQDRSKLMSDLNEQIALHPDDPKLPWRLGEAAQEGGSFLLALRCFQAALALDPRFEPARRSLAALQGSHPELAHEPGRATLLPLGTNQFPQSSPSRP
jgi:tetratricopeptide (TPR) repeat protein